MTEKLQTLTFPLCWCKENVKKPGASSSGSQTAFIFSSHTEKYVVSRNDFVGYIII